MPEAVFFDLDGTLADPKPGICGCIAHALRHMGKDVPSHNDLEWCIGPPLAGSFARLLGTDDGSEIARAVSLYRERFSDVGLFENRVYEGIPECLGRLKSAGLTLYVATSKPHVFANRILERFDLTRYFEAVYGSELDGTRSAKGDLLRHLLLTEGIDASSAIMVGDRMHDVFGAGEAGLACVGVTYGYGSREELTSAGAWVLCGSPPEVSDFVLERDDQTEVPFGC